MLVDLSADKSSQINVALATLIPATKEDEMDLRHLSRLSLHQRLPRQHHHQSLSLQHHHQSLLLQLNLPFPVVEVAMLFQ